MALVLECTPSCAQIVLDRADIVRDGDLSTVNHGFMASVACTALGLRAHNPESFAMSTAQHAKSFILTMGAAKDTVRGYGPFDRLSRGDP
jgi:hypothetical protein